MKQEVIPQFIPRLCSEGYKYSEIYKEGQPDFCRLKIEEVEHEISNFKKEKVNTSAIQDYLREIKMLQNQMMETPAARIIPLLNRYSYLKRRMLKRASELGINPNEL